MASDVTILPKADECNLCLRYFPKGQNSSLLQETRHELIHETIQAAVVGQDVSTKRCWNWECQTNNNPNKNIKVTFFSCNGCKVAVYCNVKCQKADWKWKHPEFNGMGHKKECHQLKAIFDLRSSLNAFKVSKKGLEFNQFFQIRQALKNGFYSQEFVELDELQKKLIEDQIELNLQPKSAANDLAWLTIRKRYCDYSLRQLIEQKKHQEEHYQQDLLFSPDLELTQLTNTYHNFITKNLNNRERLNHELEKAVANVAQFDALCLQIDHNTLERHRFEHSIRTQQLPIYRRLAQIGQIPNSAVTHLQTAMDLNVKAIAALEMSLKNSVSNLLALKVQEVMLNLEEEAGSPDLEATADSKEDEAPQGPDEA